MSRARPKELAHDYLERGVDPVGLTPGRAPSASMSGPEREDFIHQVKTEALAAWRSFRAEQQKTAELAKARELKHSLNRGQELSPDSPADLGRSRDRDPGLSL